MADNQNSDDLSLSALLSNVPDFQNFFNHDLSHEKFLFDADLFTPELLSPVPPENPLVSSECVAVEAVEPTTSTNDCPPPSLPLHNNWPGQYQFSVCLGPQEKNTKGVAWTFSKIKNKLYVGKDVPCPINFSTNAKIPDGITIRAMAMYSAPEFAIKPVKRCYFHSDDELKSKDVTKQIKAEHLVQCDSVFALYEVNKKTHHLSVVIPWNNPHDGHLYSTYVYRFACFGSCPGGPNRRPMMLVFTLEEQGRVIGRCNLDIKICACPGRDRISEEKAMTKTGIASSSLNLKACSSSNDSKDALVFSKKVCAPASLKRRKETPIEDGAFTIRVIDQNCYDFLRNMRNFYELWEKAGNQQSDRNITKENDSNSD